MTEFERVLVRLKSAISSNEQESVISENLLTILSDDDARTLLVQRNNMEIVLPAFVRVVLSENRGAAEKCFEYFDLVANAFRGLLPKIKRSEWWKKFEASCLSKMIPKLANYVSADDDSWVEIWKFLAKLIVTEPGLSTVPLNALLSISESAFRSGRENTAILNQAWICWMALIEAFSISTNIMLPAKMINLLLKPLVARHTDSRYRLKTWLCLLNANVNSVSEDIMNTVVSQLYQAMYTLDIPICQQLPDECVRTLIATLSYETVVSSSLPDVIDLFGKCVSSGPSANCLEQLGKTIVKCINNCPDDAKSFKLWQSLFEQCESESPNLSQARSNFFSEVNFLRWVDSGIVQSEGIVRFMYNDTFRSKVMLRSVQSMTEDEPKRKRKSTPESSWKNYTEAYLFWLERTSSSDEKPRDHDIQAVSTLVLHPIPMNNWSPSISKMWILLCDMCHKRQMLQPMIKPIFDSLTQEKGFQIQKCVDIIGFLYSVDLKSCKLSIKVLEALSLSVFNMEVKQIMEVLNLLETSASYPEMAAVIGKIISNVSDKCSEFDNLNAHKIKTKIGKIMRKMEQLTSLVENEVKPRLQRTPFRQSNFLQRLAKAEEKSKTKNSYISSVFNCAEKKREDGDEESDSSPQEMELEIKVEDIKKRGVEGVEDVCGPAIPSVLLNGKEVVAEKENVIVATASSPSPLSKLKITNARDMKTAEISPMLKKPKAIAGQKTTPKKVTPSKVSYFDDDASDCVMVPPKPKTTPLTEHQREVMSKRRTDIPALYQDLSQDTQLSSNPPTIVQIASPKVAADSEEIVDSTPSPAVPDLQTPEKGSQHKMTSAKKLDFNALTSTPPVKLSNGLNEEKDSVTVIELKEEEINPDADQQLGINETFDGNGSMKLGEGSGSRRKRKCEPTKFSPKQTRSRRSSKMSTSDDKSAETATLKKSKNVDEMKKSAHKVTASVECSGETEAALKYKSTDEVDVARTKKKASKVISGKLNTTVERKEEIVEVGKLVEEDDKGIDPTEDSIKTIAEVVPKEEAKLDVEKRNIVAEKVNGTDKLLNAEKAELIINSTVVEKRQTGSPSDEVVLTEQVDHTPTRKRRCEDAPDDLAKKMKSDGDDGSQKRTSSKKRKKPFSSGGNNLENWLVKTERLTSAEVKQEVVEKKVEEPSGDLDDSEEIVPSTQDLEGNGDVVEDEKTMPEEERINGCEGLENIEGDMSRETRAGSVLEKLSEESPNDDIELIISPTKRMRRASSVFRGEGDSLIRELKQIDGLEDCLDDECQVRIRDKRAQKTGLHAAGGRSARMLRMAASSPMTEDGGLHTPIRRRENVSPVRYGDNWPTGLTEDWVACAPTSSSPYRSALKKSLDCSTPVRQDLTTSPSYSSSKKKRVVFLDPPVTRGLIYERDSPFGSIHHANVPVGSPYPTWKGDDEPSSRILTSRRFLATDDPAVSDTVVVSEASNEVRMLIVPPNAAPKTEQELIAFRDKYQLDEGFMTTFTQCDDRLRRLLCDCFEADNMADFVDRVQMKDFRLLCTLPRDALSRVANSNNETLVDVMSAALPIIPSNTPPPVDASSQTSPIQLRSISTNTEPPSTSSSSSQADFPLPDLDDTKRHLNELGTRRVVAYLAESLNLVSTSGFK